jgi:tetratricopeptide (TPR) repeat protein
MRALTALPVPSRRFPRPLVLVATGLMAVAASYGALALRPEPVTAPPRAAVEPPGSTGASAARGVDLERLGAAIATWSANLDRDPADFIAAVNLTTLYMERGHLTGSVDDLDAALRSVDRALETAATLMAARIQRAQVLLASHDFPAAEAAALAILADEPGLPAALATLGDARLELGDIAGARSAYSEIGQDGTAPMLARQARLASLTGSLGEARRLAAEAIALAEVDPDSDLAFYHLLAGALAFQAGDLEHSLAASRAAFAAEPGSPGALVGIARAQAALGDLDGAIASYERAIAIHPDPATLAALGDLLALEDRADEAEARYAEVRAIAADPRQARLWGRAIALYLADHGAAEDAVTLAEAELATRTDVHGWDAFGWALQAAGRHAEADDAMARARALGTQDALLDYHAGIIAAAMGRTEAARQLLQQALDRNPAFDPRGAERARAALAELDGAP